MEDLSLYSTQVATVLILFDVVLAMLLSTRTKYETKKLIVTSSLMILFKELILFSASLLQPNLRNRTA